MHGIFYKILFSEISAFYTNWKEYKYIQYYAFFYNSYRE